MIPFSGERLSCLGPRKIGQSLPPSRVPPASAATVGSAAAGAERPQPAANKRTITQRRGGAEEKKIDSMERPLTGAISIEWPGTKRGALRRLLWTSKSLQV